MKAKIINEELVELLLGYVKGVIYSDSSINIVKDAEALLDAVNDCEEVEL